MNPTTIGVNIAKNVFQAHGVDQNGKVVVRKRLSRAKVLEFLANLPQWSVKTARISGTRTRTSHHGQSYSMLTQRPDIYMQSSLFAVNRSHLANRVESIYTLNGIPLGDERRRRRSNRTLPANTGRYAFR